MELNKIYWVDAKMHTLTSCTYDGTEKMYTSQSQKYLFEPLSIRMFENWIYWFDLFRSYI